MSLHYYLYVNCIDGANGKINVPKSEFYGVNSVGNHTKFVKLFQFVRVESQSKSNHGIESTVFVEMDQLYKPHNKCI